MFDGTNKLFKILYFLTAMLPAYVLFLLQIENRVININFLGFNKNKFIFMIIIIIIVEIFIGIFLKKMLLKSVRNDLTIEFSDENIKYSKNGDVISFLLSVILPSVITISDHFYINLVTFIILQVLIYKLMVRSNNIFPNILMIILDMDIYEVEINKQTNIRYIITFNGKKINRGIISRIGDSTSCNTYILEEQ